MHRHTFLSSVLLLALQSVVSVTSHLISSPARLPHVEPTAYPGIGVGHDDLFGRLPGHQLFKRKVNYDQSAIFFCPTGTCFTDSTGLIGCCTVSSCLPRTTCIAYTSSVTSPCDTDLGGCTYCSDPATPACMTITNVEANQWIHYCDVTARTTTLSYQNVITTGSQYSSTSTSTSSTTSSSSTSSSTSSSSSSSLSSTSSSSTSETSDSTTSDTTAGSSTASTSASPVPAPYSDHSLSDGAIAGIAIGGILVGVLAFAALWCLKRQNWLCFARRERNYIAPTPNEPSHGRAAEENIGPTASLRSGSKIQQKRKAAYQTPSTPFSHPATSAATLSWMARPSTATSQRTLKSPAMQPVGSGSETQMRLFTRQLLQALPSIRPKELQLDDHLRPPSKHQRTIARPLLPFLPCHLLRHFKRTAARGTARITSAPRCRQRIATQRTDRLRTALRQAHQRMVPQPCPAVL